MSDRLDPLPLEILTDWIADELEAKRSVFGIPRPLFFTPEPGQPFRTEVFGRPLETPLGIAAGPHSQLAQNIVVAWLCGARFIELKTVQTLDRLEIPKPCIDMQDEGYNVEWSQELALRQSFSEYLHAWVLIHALHHHLGFPGRSPGVVFNLSVGYDLEGIRRPNLQAFLDLVGDAGGELAIALDIVSRRLPEVAGCGVPSCLSDNVTLSTMHGCPPHEIAAIGEHLLRDRGLHTTVKLNPTLLGPDAVRDLLNRRLGYHEIEVPDEAFAHDLRYEDALPMIRGLQETATGADVDFGLKLTNTLEVSNHRKVFAGSQDTMYLSGRPLHALAVTLAGRLHADLEERPMMSFSGGADAGSFAALVRAGMRTVTVCSDLLKPGGYLRLGQYLENLEATMNSLGADSIEAFSRSGVPAGSESPAGVHLRRLMREVAEAPHLHRDAYQRQLTKTSRRLGLFDCIEAPCSDICDLGQRVPEYMRLVRDGDLAGAAAVTRADNPLASILGRTCHRPCEAVCLRTHMDRPLAIREIKRFITEHEPDPLPCQHSAPAGGPVAVVGGGPCGLSAAEFLARDGRPVTVFEARDGTGGMVSATIPDYRAARDAVDRDLVRAERLGVEIRRGQEIGRSVTIDGLREQGFDTIVIAVGAGRGLPLGLEGEQAEGVVDGLEFLRAVRSGQAPAVGPRVGVVGGGDVAMDCARTALRLGGEEVAVYYRRTRREIPAQSEELEDLLVEGGRLVELVAPAALDVRDGTIQGLRLSRMRLGEADRSGRRRPEAMPNVEIVVELDTLIVAIGQRPDLGLFSGRPPRCTANGYLEIDPKTHETSLPGVYAGGDIVGDGPASIVKAAGDGRRIAEAILASGRVADATEEPSRLWPDFDAVELERRRARTGPGAEIEVLDPTDRSGFEEVLQTLTEEAARREAERCLDCDLLCSVCDSVCPNRAILTYRADLPPSSWQPGFPITQGPQVAVLADLCNECGNCVTFCPTQGLPWRDKPRLFLDRGSFLAERDNAFMLLEHDGRRGIQGRFNGRLEELFEHEAGWRFVTNDGIVVLAAADLTVIDGHDVGIDPAHLGPLIVLLLSCNESMPEFPRLEANPSWLLEIDDPRS